MTAYTSAMRHWLLALNLGLGLFLAGGLAAPVLAAGGAQPLADALYAAYHFTCHQWAFRSFFLFGPQPIYGQAELAAQNIDPFRFTGDAALGWKMAFCERDLAIYAGLLAIGLLYARRRQLEPCGFGLYTLLIVPMALDGFTQLFGWRESTWELRILTGLLFGLASAWLVLPRLDSAFGLSPAPSRAAYPPERTASATEPAPCEPLPQVSPVPPLLPGG
jgi:uncharacterized membrane protein